MEERLDSFPDGALKDSLEEGVETLWEEVVPLDSLFLRGVARGVTICVRSWYGPWNQTLVSTLSKVVRLVAEGPELITGEIGWWKALEFDEEVVVGGDWG